MLDGFEVINVTKGVPTLTLSKNGLAFNKYAIEKMHKTRYAIPLIDKSRGRFAIVESDTGDGSSLDFLKDSKKLSDGVRWNNRELKNIIGDLMKCDIDNYFLKIEGHYSDADRALIFNLHEAKEYERRKR